VRAGKPVAAARTKTYARSCYSWALKRGKVPTNPFANLPIEAEKAERERVLSDNELRTVWAASDQQRACAEGPVLLQKPV
jgi:hypothetical protein